MTWRRSVAQPVVDKVDTLDTLMLRSTVPGLEPGEPRSPFSSLKPGNDLIGEPANEARGEDWCRARARFNTRRVFSDRYLCRASANCLCRKMYAEPSRNDLIMLLML